MTTPAERHQVISDIEHDVKVIKEDLIEELTDIIKDIVVQDNGIIGISFHTTFIVNGSKVDALIVNNDDINNIYYVLLLESGFKLPLNELNIYDLINLYYYLCRVD